MSLPSTIGAALEMGRRALESLSETPGLDAQLLLVEVLERSRAWILAHTEVAMDGVQAQFFINLVSRCEGGEALPYVIGWWEFYGRRFRLTPDVLIPRPETEMIIEAGLKYLAKHTRCRVAADVGTGCGCVAVTLAAEVPDLYLTATDLTVEALRVAKSNAHEIGVISRVRFIQADLLSPIYGSFDLICANLPYIPTRTLPSLLVAQREPRLALDGGMDGLLIIRRLIMNLPIWLANNGRALLEIGDGQAEAAINAVQEIMPASEIMLRKDLSGKDRMLVIDRRE